MPATLFVAVVLALVVAGVVGYRVWVVRARNKATRLLGRHVVVVGASSGIGEHVARLAAAHGACLTLAARRTDRLAALADACLRLGARCADVRRCDVTDPASCTAAVAGLDTIELLVLCAGIGQDFAFTETSPAAIATLLNTNLHGPLWLAKAALPALTRAASSSSSSASYDVGGGGRILVVSSMSAFLPRPRRALYAASKAAVSALFENVRTEVARLGVSVTIAYPGFVETELTAGISRIGADGSPIGSAPPASSSHRRRHGLPVMSAASCARELLGAAMARERTCITPWWYFFIKVIYSLCPTLYEHFLR
jgi:short-subunit dehydrogenase